MRDEIPYEYRAAILRGALYLSTAIMVVITGFPLYWMAQNSLKNREAILEGWSLFPAISELTLANFSMLTQGNILQFVLNSVFVSIGTVVVTVLVSLVAGYGLARFKFRGKVNFARFLLFGYMFSPIVLSIPLFMLWRQVGLLDTRPGLVIALSAVGMPFGVWLMWKYIQALPVSLEESAWVAGASQWRAFVDVIVPQTKSSMIAVALFAFSISWNNFTYAEILLPSNEKTTFPPGLLRYVEATPGAGFNELMAVSLALTLPPFLFAYFLQSYLLEGFSVRAEG